MEPTTQRIPWTVGNHWIGLDLERRRMWVAGQRLHHGVTGIALAGAGLAGLAARRLTAHGLTPRGGLEWTLIGTALVAHDWHDRSIWFQRGAGD